MIEVSQAIPYRGIRKSIGKRMEISGAYPMTYQGMYVDVTELLAYRKQVNAKKGVSLTVNDFIVKAVSPGLTADSHHELCVQRGHEPDSGVQQLQHQRDDCL